MTDTPLQAFATRVRETRRIRFGDVRRLQRDVLREGIGSREEAEILLEADGAADKVDPDWPGFLAGALETYVVTRSTGAGVDPDLVAWLSSKLPAPRTKAAKAMVQSLRAEIERLEGAWRGGGREDAGDAGGDADEWASADLDDRRDSAAGALAPRPVAAMNVS